MEPLYCFKYDDETGEIIKFKIPNYITNTNPYTKYKHYSFTEPRINKSDTHYTVPEGKLDRYVNGKVFTFTDNEGYAKGIIFGTLMDTRDNSLAEYKKYSKRVDVFLEAHKEFG